MADLISSKIMDYVNRIGKPVVTTQTTEAEEAPGIDLGNILMMLYLSDAFKKPSAGVPAGGSLPGSSMASNALLGGLASKAPGSFSGPGYPSGGTGGLPFDTSQLMQILQSLGGLSR
jgi:hypothetical protein